MEFLWNKVCSLARNDQQLSNKQAKFLDMMNDTKDQEL